ncbi:phage regulatory protein/antirepressor Ant [Methylobacterium hispanicum]|uniref:phage regulatory protein/antirepressor Ant n=1 Tax=Methylobacterium hispanicum TaxID=270350 RepID=UPI002F35A0AE
MDHDSTPHPILATAEAMPLTMSSLEIAERTGKRHDNVMRDIRAMLVEIHGEGGLLTFEDTHRNPQNGQEYPIFNLPKRECLTLVAGYSAKLRVAIIDRWIELEAQQPAQTAINPADPKVMLAVFSHLQDQVATLSGQVEELKPAAAALERIAESHGTFCRSTAAKNLQIPPHTLIRWMRTNGWTFRRPGDKDDLAYQSKIAGGLLEHKVTTGQRPDGSEWTSTQVRVTPKGMTILAKAFPPVASAA